MSEQGTLTPAGQKLWRVISATKANEAKEAEEKLRKECETWAEERAPLLIQEMIKVRSGESVILLNPQDKALNEKEKLQLELLGKKFGVDFLSRITIDGYGHAHVKYEAKITFKALDALITAAAGNGTSQTT